MIFDDLPAPDDRPEAAPAPASQAGLLARIWPRRGDDSGRLQELGAAIIRHPDAVTPYVLRGELFAERGAYHLAAADFERALALAAARIEHENWGLLAQAMQDRALDGLERIRHSTRGPADGG